MFQPITAFSGFSVSDLDEAQQFYSNTLGLVVIKEAMGLTIQLLGSENTVFIYAKEDHQPASFTILNFAVTNIDDAINELKKRGVSFIKYDNPDLPQDENGVLRGLAAGMGPDIAWFTDPAGNVLSVLQSE